MSENTFGIKLKAARNEKKIKQHEIAEHIGVARTTYANYEMGKKMPKLDRVSLIASYLGVSTDYLLNDSSTSKTTMINFGNTSIVALPVLSYPQFDLEELEPGTITDYRYYDHLVNMDHDCAIFTLEKDYQLLSLSAGDLVLVRFQNSASDGDYVYIYYNKDTIELRQINYTADAIIFTALSDQEKPLLLHDDDFIDGSAKLLGIVIEMIKIV